MKLRAGLAIIELLTILGVIIIFASVTTVLSTNAIRNAEFDRVRETLRHELFAAQADTIAGTSDSAWGVAVSSSAITRYRGTSYATRDTTYDYITTLNPDAITISGTSDVSFVRPSGAATSSASIVLTNGIATATTTVSTAGRIEIQ